MSQDTVAEEYRDLLGDCMGGPETGDDNISSFLCPY